MNKSPYDFSSLSNEALNELVKWAQMEQINRDEDKAEQFYQEIRALFDKIHQQGYEIWIDDYSVDAYTWTVTKDDSK